MPEKEKNKKINVKTSTQAIATLAILIAAQVVIAQFLTIHTFDIKISLSFIPVVIAARLYGAWGGAVVAGLGDILGYLCHPVGAWFPPITLTITLTGIIFGLFLKKSDSFWRVLFSVLISEFVISLFVTTFWIAILGYNTQDTMFWEFYWTKVGLRLVQTIALTAVKLVIIPPMLKAMDRIKFTQNIIKA